MSNTIIDFKKEVKLWFDENYSENDRIAFTIRLLITLQRYQEAQHLLDRSYNFYIDSSNTINIFYLLNKSLIIAKKQNLNKSDGYFIKQIENSLTDLKNDKHKIRIINNIFIFHIRQNNINIAKSYIDKAFDLTKNTLSNETLATYINYSILLDKKEQHLILKNKILPLAIENNDTYLLPIIYYNIALSINKTPNIYIEKAINSAILIGNYSILINSILLLNEDTFTNRYYYFLQQVYKHNYLDILYPKYHKDLLLFYIVYGNLLFNDNKLNEAEEVFLKGEKNLLSNDFSLEDKLTFYLSTFFLFYDTQNEYEKIITIANNHFKNIDDFDNTSSKFNILFFLIKSFHYTNNKEEETKILSKFNKLIETDELMVYLNLFEYYYDIKNYTKAIQYADLIIPICKTDEQLRETYEILGNIYFNKEKFLNAKDCYIKSFEYVNQSSVISSALFYNLSRIEFKTKKFLNSSILFIISNILGFYDKISTNEKYQEVLKIYIGNGSFNQIKYFVKIKYDNNPNEFRVLCRSILQKLKINDDLLDLITETKHNKVYKSLGNM